MREDVMRERGTLPPGWTILGFDQAVYTVAVTDRKVKQQDYLATGALPVVDQGQVFIGGYTDDISRRVECDLPVIVFGDHTRVVKYINFDFAAGADGIKVIKPIEAFDPKLFFYFLHVLDLPDRGYSRHFQFLLKERIPLPPLPEQHRIVAEIEKQFTRLDTGVAALKRVQANLRRYRASVLKAACEGRLAPQDPADEPADRLLARILAERRVKWQAAHGGKKYVEPAAPVTAGLPELPVGWCWASVEQITQNFDGARIPVKSSDREQMQGRYPYYGASGIIDHVNEYIFDGSYLLIAEDGANLLSRTTPIAFQAHGQFWVNNHAHVVQLRGDCPLGYLETYMNGLDLKFLITGSAQPKLTQANMNRIPVPLPPLPEQHRIVAEVERRLSVVAELEATVSADLARAGRLRQAVLKRAFEGRLVGQEAGDESAEVLLARIRGA
jgi:type I restriction enzyme S subunit